MRTMNKRASNRDVFERLSSAKCRLNIILAMLEEGCGHAEIEQQLQALEESICKTKKDLVDAHRRNHNEIIFGTLLLDATSNRAVLAGQPLELLPREWAVLLYLLNHAGQLVSKNQILGAITERGKSTSVNAIEVYISRLRAKLASAGIVIRTVRGLGYLMEESLDGGML